MDIQGPLARLAGRVRAAQPPQWRHLVSAFAEVEYFGEFRKIVHTMTPEAEAHIFATKSMYAQVARFCEAFSEKWFPLPADLCDEGWCEKGYEEIVYGIPLIPQGFMMDDLHDFDSFKPGIITLLTLLKPEDMWDQGWCVSLMAYCRDTLKVPQELLERAQEIGHDAVREAVEGDKRYSAAADALNCITMDTGNVWLDTNDEMNDSSVEWDLATVQELSRLWKDGQAIMERALDFATWLEKDLMGRFRELLEFIEERMTKPEEPRAKTLAEVFGGEDGKEESEGAGAPSAPVGTA